MLLRKFEQFANFVNSHRTPHFDFKKMVKDAAENSSKILEVGCNDRPINAKNLKFKLDGLDPDPAIDVEKCKEIFDDFYNCELRHFPLSENKKYDLIVLNMVFEHIEDNNETLSILKNLLHSDGKIVMQTPSNRHPFSLLNIVLPENVKLKILATLTPWIDKNGPRYIGWPAFYHKCNIVSLRKASRKHNLRVSNAYFDYNGSDYFLFFPPLFLLVVVYEEIVKFFRLGMLAATFTVELEHETTPEKRF